MGAIFNIQRFSIHDGPGIRTTVFFKGCPLRCRWCHNPEGLRRQPEIQFYPARCSGCAECVRACPNGAQALVEGRRVYHRDLCTHCGACVENCFVEALQKIGQELSAEQVLAEVLRDRAFYASNGGVTLSGGEPLLQPAFALEILRRCQAEGIHTAVETTAFCAWETLEALLPYTDLFMVDIKHLDPRKHQAAAGVTNERILANICRLAETGKPVIFRVPVIPTVNDTPAEIAAIAGFIRELAHRPLSDAGLHPVRLSERPLSERLALELLTFHKLAEDKYRSLGLDYPVHDIEPITREAMQALAQSAAGDGLSVRIR